MKVVLVASNPRNRDALLEPVRPVRCSHRGRVGVGLPNGIWFGGRPHLRPTIKKGGTDYWLRWESRSAWDLSRHMTCLHGPWAWVAVAILKFLIFEPGIPHTYFALVSTIYVPCLIEKWWQLDQGPRQNKEVWNRHQHDSVRDWLWCEGDKDVSLYLLFPRRKPIQKDKRPFPLH